MLHVFFDTLEKYITLENIYKKSNSMMYIIYATYQMIMIEHRHRIQPHGISLELHLL